MDKLIWGIIGAGDVVHQKSGPSFKLAQRSEIACVSRRSEESARASAEALGSPAWTTDPAEIINSKEINCVYVATPPSSHKEYTLAAMRQQKHVLVEKPMGLNGDEDRQMNGAAGKYLVNLFVAYYRRFHPHVLKMKEIIEAGTLGEVVSAEVDFAWKCPGPDVAGWRLDPAVSGGGHFADTVSHRIDLLMWLLGRMELMAGLDSKFDQSSKVEQIAAGTILFESGALAMIKGDFYSGRNADTFTITGTKGKIHAENLDSQSFELETDNGCEQFDFNKEATHLGLITHIEAAVIDSKPNFCSGKDGLETDLVLDAVLNR